MRLQKTALLLVLFSATMGLFWWLQWAEVPTADQRQAMVNRLLPELIDVTPNEIRRLEIDRGTDPGDKAHGPIVVVRGREGWQMLTPVDTAADDSVIETLARNLKDIRKSADAGTITDDPKKFGLDKPAATIRVYIRDHKSPEATLEVGEAVGERLYVRAKGTKGIEVVDARLLSALRLPAAGWRDKALFHMPSFRVASLTVRDTKPGRDFKVERDQRRWKLVSPVKAPADDEKVEGLVAELSALRIIDGPDAFVADDVKDLSPFGLDKPETTIEVAPFGASGGEPALGTQTLLFGKPVPDHPNQVYAKRGSQDDVIRVDTKILRESLPGPTALRSQKVLDLIQNRAYRIRIESGGKLFDMATADGNSWRLLSPIQTGADSASVHNLLMRLADLKASEFLEPNTVSDSKLDPPFMRVRVWQIEPGSRTSPEAIASGETPKDDPAVDLALGRHDVLKKTVFGRLPGDSLVLALPDSLLDALPKNDFAFRDRTVLTLPPATVERLSVVQNGRLVTVVAPPVSGSKSEHWRMAVPIGGRADDTSVTGLLVALSNLHCESWEADSVGDGKAWGLDAPWLKVSWAAASKTGSSPKSSEGGETRSLKVGKQKPKSQSHFATLEGDPRVFLLPAVVISALQTELRDRTVLAFPPAKVESVVLRWPERTLALERLPTREGSPPLWQPAPGYDPSGFDLGQFGTIVAALNDLKANRFLRDDGPFPAAAGLSPPRVTIEVHVVGETAPRVLRIGNDSEKNEVLATTTLEPQGPLLSVPLSLPWSQLLRAPSRSDELPPDPFVVEPKPVAPAP